KIGIEIPGKDCIQIKPGGPNIIIALLIILIGCAGNYGRQVGIWYSIWDWTTVIVDENKRVLIFPPAMEELFGNGGGRKRTKF
ncbi:MAG: hypothetical protein ACYTGS_06930, partial [Planctomycetota bacterium]